MGSSRPSVKTALDGRPSGRIRAWRHRRPACRNEINDARHGDLVLNSGNNRAGREPPLPHGMDCFATLATIFALLATGYDGALTNYLIGAAASGREIFA